MCAGVPSPSSLVVDPHNPPYEEVLIDVGVGTMLFGIVVVCPWHRLPLLVVVGWHHLLALPNVAGTRDPPYEQRLVGMARVLVIPCQFWVSLCRNSWFGGH
jgi:hypothetical protein